jgi:cell division protein FtsI/penicillin-binding protein 2
MQSQNTYTRSEVLIWGLLIVLGIFVMRLFYLQVIQHDYFVAQADKIQIQPLTIQPERGELYVYDRDELVPLVLNERVYTVFADPSEIKDTAKTSESLRKIIGGELSSDVDSLLKDDEGKVRYRVIARNVSRTQAEKVEKEQLRGIGLQQTNRRLYPEGSLAAQTLGYLDIEGKGQYGIEGALNDRLRGKEGLLETVTDVSKIPLTIGNDDINKPAKDGDNLVLTIDRSIQLQAEALLKAGLDRAKASKGSVVVMDPNTGAVLAMANYPTYDPAQYNKVEDYSVFQNGIVSAPYENGSVIKALTMGAGLDSGAVTVNSTFDDSSGCTQVEDRRICNVEEDPKTASATMLDTLKYSLNTGVVHIAKQMGGGEMNRTSRDTLYRYYHDQYRFGQLTGIEQTGESAGIIIAPDQQEGNNVRYANMVFGQGMDQTMIQTVSAFSAEINGGTYYQPRLVAGIRENDGDVTEKEPVVVKNNVLSPQASQQARDLIWQGRKTGFFGKFDRDGYMIGGKTGTSQVIDPKTGEYSDTDSIGTYLGFGGVDSPQYVIMVKVDNAKIGGYEGTTAAGPIFNDLNNWMIDYLKLQPKRN